MTTSQTLALNQWHYVGASYDHVTGITSVWLDGERVLQQDMGAGITLATQDDARMAAVSVDNRYLTGRIAAMQVYDVALTAKQINQVKEVGQGRHLCHLKLLLCLDNISLLVCNVRKT